METNNLATRLARFLQLQKPLLVSQSVPEAALGYDKLANLISELSPHLALRATAGDATDIWSVVGLKRNEVQTARVLAWLLDPSGSHGYQDAILWALWQQIAAPLRPFHLGKAIRARREIVPLGDTQNRVDIEIEGDDFLLIIEVKIDARDQPDQLNRHLNAAKAKAGARKLSRYGVLYLTPGRNLPDLHGCVPITWLDVARAIEAAASSRPVTSVGTHLGLAFADHIRAL